MDAPKLCHLVTLKLLADISLAVKCKVPESHLSRTVQRFLIVVVCNYSTTTSARANPLAAMPSVLKG